MMGHVLTDPDPGDPEVPSADEVDDGDHARLADLRSDSYNESIGRSQEAPVESVTGVSSPISTRATTACAAHVSSVYGLCNSLSRTTTIPLAHRPVVP
jgi:hypothetical protein